MLDRLGSFAVSRRKSVLVGTAVFFLVAAGLGGGVASRLSSGGFDDPASESSRAAEQIKHEFGKQEPDLVFLVRAKRGTVDAAAVGAAAETLTHNLAAEKKVARVVSYWSLGSPPPLRSKDGREALVLVSLHGDEDHVQQAARELSPKYATTGSGPITVRVGGFAEVFRQVNHQVEADLLRAELIAFPITLLLMVLVFGSVVAAGLPLVVGGLAIVGTFLVLLIVASLTEVSIFALNLTTGMGLGLAIDYSLFVVSRYREELHNGREPHDAVVRTVQTAGKTVAFSALTVAVALAALLVFPLAFLRSFAYAGIGVALLAGFVAIVSLPALLAVLGPRVNSLRLLRRDPKPVGEGVWHRIATFVMRRPVPIALGVIALLIVLGLPFLRIQFGLPDDRVLPTSASSRQVQDDIRTRFASNEALTLQAVATGIGDPAAHADELDRYAAALSRAPGAARVDALTGSYINGQQVAGPGPLSARFATRDATWLSVVPSVEPYSDAGERLAKSVRATPAPFRVLVTGNAATLVDSKHSLFSRLPLAAGLIALATFVLLFLMFGSILVPVKALVLNVLSLSATFGALVWIFQDGHLSGFLDFTPTGTLPATVPLLLFCLAFGLSMDYEVFLLSRIKEEHDRTHDNTHSVAVGLERTGRIVTAAAVLISVVFIAFATSGVSFIKIFGLGLTIAVLMDAFVIRATLVPAFMRIAGEANWWAPNWMRRIHERIGISETEEPAPEAAVAEDQVREPVGSR
ncbi:MAG TPA: MMPL family transporter [Acidimicrobiia bacterium]|nr:MMPL family transporter [Acidimicrobiia bacterium]